MSENQIQTLALKKKKKEQEKHRLTVDTKRSGTKSGPSHS